MHVFVLSHCETHLCVLCWQDGLTPSEVVRGERLFFTYDVMLRADLFSLQEEL